MRGPHAVVAVGVLLDELEVVLGADQRPRVAGQSDDRQPAEDGVDRAPLEPELAQVRAGEEGARRRQECRRRRSVRSASLPPCSAA